MKNLVAVIALSLSMVQSAQATKSCQEFTDGNPVLVKDGGKTLRLCSVIATSHITSGQGLDIAMRENLAEARRLCKERGTSGASPQKVHSVEIPSLHGIRVIEAFICG
jgi:hypothetical protein